MVKPVRPIEAEVNGDRGGGDGEEGAVREVEYVVGCVVECIVECVVECVVEWGAVCGAVSKRYRRCTCISAVWRPTRRPGSQV